jgi:D-beta-D-heptose 7-phosphate kinase/D-beta-D-heptose 1-phosphate adenosyltransferase
MGETLIDWRELKRELEARRAEAALKVVFTNGCFDILHAGHVGYLREARGLGDVLVVGLNSDRSVAAIKPGRPIVPEARRAEVLAALEMVDFVTVFDDDTPYELIKFLGPDVLVKGGDWRIEDIVGSDVVPETYSLPFIEGISTTSIIRRIQGLKDVGR